MRNLLLLAALLALLLPARAAEDTAALIVATKAFVLKESPGMQAKVAVEKIDGDYARVRVSSSATDTAHAFLKRKKGRWTVLTLGTGLTPDEYRGLGIPKSLKP